MANSLSSEPAQQLCCDLVTVSTGGSTIRPLTSGADRDLIGGADVAGN